MQAFLNDPKVKQKYLDRVHAHFLADEIIKGKYWENGKGCAVGCSIHSSKHKDYETLLGIPEWLAHLEDRLFEGMSDEKAKAWPEAFFEAINVGADLSLAKAPFLIKVLERNIRSIDACINDAVSYPIVKKTIENCRRALIQMIDAWKDEDELAVKSAQLACSAAASAAASAAYSADSAQAAYSADSAYSVQYDEMAQELLEILRSIK